MHMDRPVPSGFSDTEDWLLHYIFHHPKEDHSTHSLFQQLDSILKAEPSQLDESNRTRGVLGEPRISAEDYEALRKPKLSGVQRAVETLYEKGLARGKLDADNQGVVFFRGLHLTVTGKEELIRRTRTKEEKAKRDMAKTNKG
jgi:hypothetical protein